MSRFLCRLPYCHRICIELSRTACDNGNPQYAGAEFSLLNYPYYYFGGAGRGKWSRGIFEVREARPPDLAWFCSLVITALQTDR